MRIGFLGVSPWAACYSPDTDVLTRSGWKHFPEVTYDDEIATRAEDGGLTYSKPIWVVQEPFDGKMYSLKSKNLDLMVTPNHRIYASFPKHGGGWGKYRLSEARDIAQRKNALFLRGGCIWDGEVKETFTLGAREIPMTTWLEFLGYFIGDGYTTLEKGGGYVVGIRQKSGRPVYERLRLILHAVTPASVHFMDGRVVFRDKELCLFLRESVRSSHDHTRRIPREFMELCAYQLELLWRSIVATDGHSRKTWSGNKTRQTVYTSSPQLRDDLQELLLKIGFAGSNHQRLLEARLMPSEQRIITPKSPGFVVERLSNLHVRKRTRRGSSLKEEWVPYKGLVYCVEVPGTHVIYVRRNGKTLWCGNTGYGMQTRGIIHGLLDKYEIYCLAHESGSAQVVWGGNKLFHYPDGKTVQTLVMTNPLQNPLSAIDMVVDYSRKYRLDLIVCHWDAFALEFMNKVKMPWLAYVPTEGEMTRKWYYFVRNANKIVSYSRYGREQFSRFAPAWQVDYIRHGIDVANYSPAPAGLGRAELRKMLTSQIGPVPEDCFLFGSVAANNGPRKMSALMIRTFAKFAKEHKDAHLYLHTNQNTPIGQGYDLPTLIDILGIGDRVHFPTENPILVSKTDGQMADLYRACDVTMSNSVGEGFGLPVLESLACGIPVIAPNNSSHPELVGENGERGWLVDNVPEDVFTDYPVYTPYLSTFPLPDQRSLLAKMEEAYSDEKARRARGAAGIEFAKSYSWERVIPEWDRLLTDVGEDVAFFRSVLDAYGGAAPRTS